MLCLVAQWCLPLCSPCSPPGSSVHGDFPGKNTGVGCHALLQSISPTQGLNPGLPCCRRIFYHLSHQGNPILGVIAPIRRQNTDLMFTFKRSVKINKRRVNVIVIPKEDDVCILCSDIPF